MKIRNGDDIRAERSRVRMSQADLAKQLGWDRSILIAVEQNDPLLADSEYERIGKLLEEIAGTNQTEAA